MTEEERNEIISTAENDANLENPEEYREVAMIRIQADIARQHTIANEIAHMRAINELRATQGLAVAYPEESFDKVFDNPTPAPDALVDRLAGLLRQAQGRIKGDAPLSNEIESVLEVYRAGYSTVAPKQSTNALVEAVRRFFNEQEITIDYLKLIHSEELLVGVKNLIELKSAFLAHERTGDE